MKIPIHILFLLVLLSSCSNSSKSKLDNELINSMKSEGYSYIDTCNPPMGISDTLLLGYTERDRFTGIFHKKELRFKNLKISGLKFEKITKQNWTDNLFLYKFEFTNEKERIEFEAFQDYLINYQSHGKNQAEFYQQDSTWILRYHPMI